MPTARQASSTTLKPRSSGRWSWGRPAAGIGGGESGGVGRVSVVVLTRTLAEAPHQPNADEVEDQGEHEQHRSDREQRLIANRPGRLVARGGLRDEPGHRLARLEWVEAKVCCGASRDRHDHRLADGSADPEDDRGDDARDRRRKHDPDRDLPLRAAQPYAPSRSAWGTAVMASSASEAIVGMIMMPMTRPAASMLKVPTSVNACRIDGVMNVRAKKP